jgi:putative Mg2+ transporter-C (MgtC) family protein
MTAAVGIAVGLGSLGLALLSTILTVIVLALLGQVDYEAEKKQAAESENIEKY